MGSLDLNTLAHSLPTANLANAEKDLLNNFKGSYHVVFILICYPVPTKSRRSSAAALSITTLYRSSLHTSKRAYNAGYAAACQDLLSMIQQGVSVGGVGQVNDSDGNGMTIGRVMDWIEARLEAVKSREEEEEEEEEKVAGGSKSKEVRVFFLSLIVKVGQSDSLHLVVNTTTGIREDIEC